MKLLERIGPAILVLPSWAMRADLQAAVQTPDLVPGVVVLEPVGCPTGAEHPFFDASIPFLAVYGNFIEARSQRGRLRACRSTASILAERGTPAEVLVLPEVGIKGSSHLMMQDDNSNAIAKRIIDWTGKHVAAVWNTINGARKSGRNQR